MSHYPFPNQVQRAIDGHYDFKFGDYISRGFNIVSSNIGMFLAGAFVLSIVMILCAIVSMIPLIGAILAGGLFSCVSVGYFVAAAKQDKSKGLIFSDFFSGFNHFGQLVLFGLLSTVIILICFVPTYLAIFIGESTSDLGSGFPPLTIIFAVLLGIIPVVYLSVGWIFTTMNVVFHKMSAWDAMEASRQIISKNWFMFFLFGIVVGIIGGLGFLLFGVGALFTYPAAMAMTYAAYDDIVGSEQAELQMMDHFVE